MYEQVQHTTLLFTCALWRRMNVHSNRKNPQLGHEAVLVVAFVAIHIEHLLRVVQLNQRLYCWEWE